MFFLGTIQGTGPAVSNNTQPTGAFALPATTKAVYLQPSASGVQWQMFAGSSAGASAAGATGTAPFLSGPNQINGPYRCGPTPVLSIVGGPGGLVSVRVWSAPTS